MLVNLVEPIRLNTVPVPKMSSFTMQENVTFT